MIRRALLVLLAAVFLGALVACGGGGGTSSSEDSADGSEPAEESEIGDAASADAPAEPEESGAGAEDDATVPGDPESAESTPELEFTGEGGESFCTQMTDIQVSFENVSEPTGATYADLAARIQAVSPPPELAADWPFFVEMNNALAADPSGETLTGPGGEANAQRFSEVSTKVSEYMNQVCGL